MAAAPPIGSARAGIAAANHRVFSGTPPLLDVGWRDSGYLGAMRGNFVGWVTSGVVTLGLGFLLAPGCSSGTVSEGGNKPAQDAALCGPGTAQCGDRCVDLQLDPKNCGACAAACPDGELCSLGKCDVVCLGGTTRCGDACADTKTDPANCGACANTCAAGELCSGGKCALACLGGTTLCQGVCVNTQTDSTNCGGCGTACATGQICVGGACGIQCAGGTSKCAGTAGADGGATAEVCVNTKNDPNHCGACNQPCAEGESCASGTCSSQCSGGTTSCGGTCVNTQTDSANCGACNTACPAGQGCVAGQCSLICGGGTTKCGNACVNTQVDPANCGACGTVCSTGQVCSASTCTLQCSGGTTKCGNVCVNTQTDPAHCGGCSKPCASGASCSSGVCQAQCGSGTTLCGIECVNLQTNGLHCGACNKPCATGLTCTSAVCCQSGQSVCAGACTTTATDPNNCGGCGVKCGATTPFCTSGACTKGIMLVGLNEGHTGNLGGVTGANALCAQQATAAGITGTWKAFLSTSTQAAKDLFTGVNAALPVVNRNGGLLYTSWTSVFTSPTWPGIPLLYSFNNTLIDENSAIIPTWTDADGWTGTLANGTASPNTCQNWTSALTADLGIAGELDFKQLLVQESHTCDYTAAVLCVALKP